MANKMKTKVKSVKPIKRVAKAKKAVKVVKPAEPVKLTKSNSLTMREHITRYIDKNTKRRFTLSDIDKSIKTITDYVEKVAATMGGGFSGSIAAVCKKWMRKRISTVEFNGYTSYLDRPFSKLFFENIFTPVKGSLNKYIEETIQLSSSLSGFGIPNVGFPIPPSAVVINPKTLAKSRISTVAPYHGVTDFTGTSLSDMLIPPGASLRAAPGVVSETPCVVTPETPVVPTQDKPSVSDASTVGTDTEKSQN